MASTEKRAIQYGVMSDYDDLAVLTNPAQPAATFQMAKRSYSIFTVKGVKVLFLNFFNSATQVYPFLEESSTLNLLVPGLKNFTGAQVVVAKMVRTAETRNEDTYSLVKLVSPHVDIAIGGFDTFNPVKPVQKMNSTWLIYDKVYANNITVFDYDFEKKEIVSYREVRVVPFPSTLMDGDYFRDAATLQRAVDIAARNNPIVGMSSNTFPSYTPAVANCRVRECELGNFWTAAINSIKTSIRMDFVVINGGAIRVGWDAGYVRLGQLRKSFPFSNLPCIITMWGADIWGMFNHTVSVVPPSGDSIVNVTGSGRFFQGHNVRFSFDSTRNHSQTRLLSVEIWNRETKIFEPLSRRRLYTFMTTEFVCNGGDGYNPKPVQPFSILSIDVVSMGIEYIRALGGNATAFLDGRIQRKPFSDAPEFIVLPKTQEDCEVNTYWRFEVRDCDPCPQGYTQPLTGQTSCVVDNSSSSKLEETWWFIVILSVVGFVIVVLISVTIIQRRVIRFRTRDVAFAPRTPPIALMFTDIQSSTKLWNYDNRVMAESVKLHHNTIRRVITLHKAYEVKTIGDSFMIACSTADVALQIANEIQIELMSQKWDPVLATHDDAAIVPELFHGLRVRIGVHIGMPQILWDEVAKGYDYYGDDVNITARLEAVATGGQTIISEAFYKALDDKSKQSCVFTSLGSVELKGVPEPILVYQALPHSLGKRVFDEIHGLNRHSASGVQMTPEASDHDPTERVEVVDVQERSGLLIADAYDNCLMKENLT
eukprot:PhF_6_TR19583/c0_g1_i1/m.28554